MPVKITHKITGASELKQRIAHIQQGIPALFSREELGGFLLDRMRARFLREEDPEGRKWKKLSPASKKGPQILIQQGNLFKAIDIIGGTNKGQFAVATGAGFRIGVKHVRVSEKFKGGASRTVDTAFYGRLHHMGIGVPKRRFLGVGPKDIVAVEARLRSRMRRLLAGGGV